MAWWPAVAGLLLAACQGAAPPAPAPDWLPELTGRVTDEADLLLPADEQALARASERVERERGHQFVVVTVDSLHGRSIEDFGLALGRTWGIGRRDHNDGLILLVAPNERKVRIEVGYGLERRITDPYAARVIDRHILPRFRDGDFRGGIRAGSDALIERLTSSASDAQIARIDGIVS